MIFDYFPTLHETEVSDHITEKYNTVLVACHKLLRSRAAQPGVWGDMGGHFLDQGVQGGTGGGTMKMIFASTAFSTVEVTEFQLP